ncbi:cytochrome-c oxidase, cbb3-type subunit I [Ruficoccus amylovorans]|uniref:cytochrome-c oxidase n=1 Tax=Ruficoccus amylovorans TaxID=1804625 RepID=A0A842HGV5_9BACT|nr:cytochrome-c oxidase, cbb3-type subunit I [Ruficoccus amylovorans]MBC2594794.1 cytochrome-c oxidase, cbb3-type subunit I [Ruficoccus amylovorans]
MSEKTVTVEYNDRIVRYFMLASIVWGIVGMGAGVVIALQLSFWQLNFDTSFLTFGRLRPLHTNAAIFAFVGNMMFAGIYYSTQRLCRCRLASDFLSNLHFWGWQLIIVAAAITLPLGFTQGKEYAELIWPIDIAVAGIWLVFAANFFWTLGVRRERSLYVAIWFYIATIVTVTMLYVVNNLAMPTSWLHSYSIYGGVQDALVQWWYGHNAVAFFLTTPILGIMYYFIPKAANRPIYSYRLSVVHFWSLVFIYIWAGPHHLLNTALPGWLQGLGMLFSVMLWAPSWGGMLNGLLTLRGAWDRLRTDPVIKFLAAGVTFYGMATFEGPLMAVKAVNSLSHYTDWTIGHVHAGTLGWNGFMAAGMFYWLAPRLWKNRHGIESDPKYVGTSCAGLWSPALANMHFWVGLVGILLYVAAMWVGGIGSGLMYNATTEGGTLLAYPNFVEVLDSGIVQNAYILRAIGGFLYLSGFGMLAVNILMTVRRGLAVNGTIEVHDDSHGTAKGRYSSFVNAPVLYTCAIIISALCWIFGEGLFLLVGLFATTFFTLMAIIHFEVSGAKWSEWYDKLLEHTFGFTILTIIAAAIGGAVQIIPTLVVERAQNLEGRIQIEYTPLELAGRDIYVAEGCYNCHSQMIRTLVPDVMRYGRDHGYSRLGESIYDYPFQWGSKRTGPDLAREGGPISKGHQYMRIGLRDNTWHYRHFLNPRDPSPGSNMPKYPWLATQEYSKSELPMKINAMRKLGVPYPLDYGETEIYEQVSVQGNEIASSIIAKDLKDLNPDWTDEQIAERTAKLAPALADKKIIALIAYVQKLGAYRMKGQEPVERNVEAVDVVAEIEGEDSDS